MRILVTNDDGIDAPGLAILTEAARALSDEVFVVAPATEQSGQSHAVTLVDPLRCARIDDRRWAVEGTPADCVAMAFSAILDEAPDLVVSGVNQGFNVADDMLYSGTVGAAMQGAAMGARSIAFSQAYRRLGQEREADIWGPARAHCAATLKALAGLEGAPSILNVNFPACGADQVAGMEAVRQGTRESHEVYTERRVDGRGQPYHWLRFRRDAGAPAPGTDLSALAANRIAVTPLAPDLTDHSALDALEGAL